MSVQLFNVVNKVLAMKYFKNETARSSDYNYGHEYAVTQKVLEGGFVEDRKENYPKLKKSLLKKWAETGDDTKLRLVTQGMAPGSFILQPAGSQGFPDILVKDFNDRYVALECKSGKDGSTPMWNDNLPKPDTVYILSSGKTDSTTIFLGRDVLPITLIESQRMMILELNKIVDKYRLINKQLDQFNRGWDIKFRPQNFQSGGKAVTDYFNHPSRSMCEKNALEFCKQ
jgi:hypothetical protein